MIIDSKLQSLRTLTRNNSKTVIQKIISNHVIRENGKAKVYHKRKNICAFCGSNKNLSKEHVIPKWTFEKCTERDFITNINGKSQTYNLTAIPVCTKCNTDFLSYLEKYIKQLFVSTDLAKTFFTFEELENIIRWLEIIDYKFQILNIRRKFYGEIEYLRDFPISLLRLNKNYTPSRVISEIRHSRNRITIKSKAKKVNSLVIFKTSNPNFHFFHTMDKFIFIEMPKLKVALFYFYNEIFDDIKDANKEAMKIIEEVY